MLAGVGVLGADLRLGLSLRFVRPTPEDFLAELPEFLDHSFFGGVGVGAVGDGLVERVQQVVQARVQLGPVGQAFFERAVGLGNAGGRCRFIVHQPLYL